MIAEKRKEGHIFVGEEIEARYQIGGALDFAFNKKLDSRVSEESAFLKILRDEFRINGAYQRVLKRVSNQESEHLHDLYYMGIDLIVPDEAREFLLFYFSLPQEIFQNVFSGKNLEDMGIPLMTQDNLLGLLKQAGISEPVVDDRLLQIINTAMKVSAQLDLKSVYDLYYRIFVDPKQYRSTPEFSEDGSLRKLFVKSEGTVEGRIETLEASLNAGKVLPDTGDVIQDDPLINILQDKFGITGVYMKNQTVVNEEPGRHYAERNNNTYIYVPKDSGDFVQFYLQGGGVLLHSLELKDKVDLGVRILGKGSYVSQMGNKEAGFLVFERLGLPYPPGIVLSEELVKDILAGSDLEQEGYIKLLRSKLKDIMADPFLPLMVRSNPKRSMPGVLETIPEGNSGLIHVIREVAQAWDSPAAKAYRQREGMADVYDLPIIIQQRELGYKTIRGDRGFPDRKYEEQRQAAPSLPFYGAGVLSTRNPNTNAPGLFGNYLENATGDELMTGGEKGNDISTLAQAAPDIYRQLLEAGEKLEKDAGPQEVEFVVNDGKLYFVQTRKISFAPQAEINYLQQLLAEAKITEARAIPQVERLQQKLGARKLYKVKDAIRADGLAKAGSTTPGAMQGRLVWNVEIARKLMREGKPIIFVANKTNQEEILSVIFDYPQSGLITNYGNSSSHEAVLTRLAGISSLINMEALEWRLTGDGQGIVLLNGEKLEEGSFVVIDGDRNRLFKADANVLEEVGIAQDASYGIDIPSYRKAFLVPYLNEDGSIKLEYTVQRLEELNQAATEKFIQLEKGDDKKLAFTANLEKHFLHDILTKQVTDQSDKSMGNIKGGIDLTRDKIAVEVKRSGQGVQIKFDPAKILQFQNALGLTPVIIDISPITTTIPVFLGLLEKNEGVEANF